MLEFQEHTLTNLGGLEAHRLFCSNPATKQSWSNLSPTRNSCLDRISLDQQVFQGTMVKANHLNYIIDARPQGGPYLSSLSLKHRQYQAARLQWESTLQSLWSTSRSLPNPRHWIHPFLIYTPSISWPSEVPYIRAARSKESEWVSEWEGEKTNREEARLEKKKSRAESVFSMNYPSWAFLTCSSFGISVTTSSNCLKQRSAFKFCVSKKSCRLHNWSHSGWSSVRLYLEIDS